MLQEFLDDDTYAEDEELSEKLQQYKSEYRLQQVCMGIDSYFMEVFCTVVHVKLKNKEKKTKSTEHLFVKVFIRMFLSH